MKLPQTVYVYQCDTDDDGNPILSAAASIEDIPEDQANATVAEYIAVRQGTFVVKREMVPAAKKGKDRS